MVSSLFNKVFRRGGSDVDQLLQDVVERRVSPRFPLCHVTSIFVTQRPLSAVIVDISLSGARFATRLPREAGTVVGLEVTVEGVSMTLPLRVTWDRFGGRYFENGGSFVDLTDIERDHLVRFAEWASRNPPDANDDVDLAELLMARAVKGLPQLLPM